jgi:glycosyltransferase involved in cell wall biosynthesis
MLKRPSLRTESRRPSRFCESSAMNDGPPPTRVVHLVEPGGRGGVFQHALALAEALSRVGIRVRLHTADDPERLPAGSVEVCSCMRWRRNLPAPLRPLAVARGYLGRALPHLLAGVRAGDRVHFEGLFIAPLTTLTLLALRARAVRIVHSPHNTFARYGGRIQSLLLRVDARLAHASIVFSQRDKRAVEAWRGRPVYSPLVMYTPAVSADESRRWRERWRATGDREVVLFAGQIRRDKRLDLLIEAASTWPSSRRLAVVGEDKGDLDRCRALAEARHVLVEWEVGFLPLEKFVAAVAAADLVACPYDRGNSSAVLVVAAQLGVPTVATDVGDLLELADRSVPPGDASALARAIESELRRGDRLAKVSATSSMVAAHLAAYDLH